jgi:mannosyltransferase OCH1-like enzyme
MIPRIIHQTWKNAEVPKRFRAAQQSWRSLHPDWDYMFWTDADITRLVADEYPELVSLFRRYPDQIQRVDAARYLILYKYGGVYADLDVVCRRSFEDLRSHGVFFPATKPLGISNDLMGCAKHSTIFAYLIKQLEPAYFRYPRWIVPRHFRVLLTTGSLFVTAALRRAPGGENVTILSGDQYGANPKAQPYVTHLPGGTWHHWDSRLLGFISKYCGIIGTVAVVLGLAVIAVLWL